MSRFASLLLLLALPLGLPLAGCATIFTGTTDAVSITTDPEGARIYVNGVERGRTPEVVRVKRSINDTVIRLELEGYEPYTYVLDKTINPVSFINLFNPLFWAIDAATGAVVTYSPQTYDFALEADVAVDVRSLPLDDEGRRVVPAMAGRILLVDAESGLRVLVE